MDAARTRTALLAVVLTAVTLALVVAVPRQARAAALGDLDDTLRGRGFAAPYAQALPGGGGTTESFIAVTFLSEADSDAAYRRETDEIARIVWRDAGCPVAKILVAGTRTGPRAPAGDRALPDTLDLTAAELRARYGPQDPAALSADPCWEARDDGEMSTAGMVAALLLVVVPAVLAGAFAAWLVTFTVMRRGRDRLVAALGGWGPDGLAWDPVPGDDGGPPIPPAPVIPAPGGSGPQPGAAPAVPDLPGPSSPEAPAAAAPGGGGSPRGDAVPGPGEADGTLVVGEPPRAGAPGHQPTPPASSQPGPADPGGTS